MSQRDHRHDLEQIARDAGVRAHVHAVRLSEPTEPLGLAADVEVAIASVYKLPLALVWADLVEAGELDPAEPLRLAAGARMPGPTGIAVLQDDVTMTQRDLIRLMLTISDNAAGDAIFGRIRSGRIHHRLTQLGLPAALVRQSSAEETRAILRDTESADRPAALRALADPDHPTYTSQYDPAYSSAATPDQLTAVLRILWSRAGRAHDLVRAAMARQAWRHRIGSGFPHDDVTIFGKTGSLGSLRHEAAVVHFPHEYPIAVAVLTQAVRPEQHLPRVDAAIGELARRAVTPLRMPDTPRPTPPARRS
ncbi:serine hydrolase [Occultella glacieicola]|uniref:Serine hydrolase n=1 Tax=Occultella glacieicola TaxID=2518684 RepID=A0ABY2E0Z4_9MICO|nr:serine hydrolase [Occultella glacieicola]TDE91598.1 serine hydrolase [Occultella glacieicola]